MASLRSVLDLGALALQLMRDTPGVRFPVPLRRGDSCGAMGRFDLLRGSPSGFYWTLVVFLLGSALILQLDRITVAESSTEAKKEHDLREVTKDA